VKTISSTLLRQKVFLNDVEPHSKTGKIRKTVRWYNILSHLATAGSSRQYGSSFSKNEHNEYKMCDPYIRSPALTSHQSGEMRKLINKIVLPYGTKSGLIQMSLSRLTATFEQAQCPTFPGNSWFSAQLSNTIRPSTVYTAPDQSVCFSSDPAIGTGILLIGSKLR